MKLRKEMGEEKKKKEKTKAKESNTSLKNTLLKKKKNNYTVSDLCGGCWVSAGVVGF